MSNVYNPEHYGGKDNPYEAIKIIEALDLDFHLGNALKYTVRAGKKDPNKEIEDLQKAVWYLERKIDILMDQRKECTNCGEHLPKGCNGKFRHEPSCLLRKEPFKHGASVQDKPEKMTMQDYIDKKETRK